jgi:phosphate-selective porin OprO and OprP
VAVVVKPGGKPAKAPLNASYVPGEGFGLESDDGKFKLKVGGYLHADGRFFIGDEKDKLTHQFLLRRARPVIEGTVFKYFDLRFMPDFGGGKAVIQDAYGDIHFVPWARLRVGKFKEPFGLERLQSATAMTFIERGLPTNLAPNRDVGAQLHGDIADTVSYAVGVFNGVADGGSGDGDIGDDKDIAARVFIRPFKLTGLKILHEVGAGFAITYGEHHGKQDAPEVAQLRTPGQASFFSFRSGTSLADTVIAEGTNLRLSPQGYAYVGPVGVLGEYVHSSQTVRLDAASADVDIWAWQLAGTVVLTGEKASYKGVSPEHPVGEGGFGAIELSGRFGQINPSGNAFNEGFADLTKSADRATSWTLGVTEHFNRAFKLVVNFDRTTFTSGGKDEDRPTENVIAARLQAVL